MQFARDGIRLELDLGEYTQRRIYYRCHEESEAAFVRRFLRPGDALVDVGANIGFFTVLGAMAVGQHGIVVSIEPHEGSLCALQRNVALNGLGNVVTERAAAADVPGTMTLGLESVAFGDRGGFTEDGREARFTAPAVTLDDLLGRTLDDRLVRLLKIDVEGLEPRVLAGSKQLLGRHAPDALIVELNREALARHGFGEDDVLDPLCEAGYSFHEVGLRGRLRRFRPPGPRAGSMLLGPLRGSYDAWRSLRNVVAVRSGVTA